MSGAFTVAPLAQNTPDDERFVGRLFCLPNHNMIVARGHTYLVLPSSSLGALVYVADDFNLSMCAGGHPVEGP